MTTQFDPIRELDRFFTGAGRTPATTGMPMDLYRAGDHYVASFDVPGVDPGTIDVSVDGNTLTVSAERTAPHDATDWIVSWTLKPEGTGTRVFLLHDGFDPDDEFQQLSRKFMGGGWANHIPRALGDVLDDLDA